MSAESFKIAILGAGPAGLTLAALLNASSHAYNFTIFELRGKPDIANVNVPSGSLDLQQDFGLAAVKDCGLYDRFLEIDSGCTEQTKITDRNGKVLLDREGEGRPEISRNALAQLLLSGVPEERIQWNTKVVKVSPATASEKGLVEFVDGDSTRSEAFDLIIGADGAWSRARASIPGAVRPVNSGTISITLDVPTINETHPDLDALLGGGTFVACGDAKCILTQRSLHHSARLYFFLHVKCQAEMRQQLKSSAPHDEERRGPNPVFDTKRLLSSLPTNHKDLKELLLTNEDFFGTWPESIKNLITVSCDAQPADSRVDAGPLHMLPLDPFPHPHTKAMALIGDAAHLMTPFAGKGVNTAMADASYLAKHLDALFSASKVNFEAQLDKTLIAFEQESHEKGKAAMALTWSSLLLTYEDGAPVRLIEVMSGKH